MLRRVIALCALPLGGLLGACGDPDLAPSAATSPPEVTATRAPTPVGPTPTLEAPSPTQPAPATQAPTHGPSPDPSPASPSASPTLAPSPIQGEVTPTASPSPSLPPTPVALPPLVEEGQVTLPPEPTPDPCEGPIDPGFKPLQRLNRSEYNNTVRDLLGDTSRPADAFPVDDRAYGFDNIAEVLTVSSLLVEKYDAAAERLVETALGPLPPIEISLLEAEGMEHTTGYRYEDGWLIDVNGSVYQSVELPWEGDYDLTVEAFQQPGGDEPAKMALLIDGVELTRFDVTVLESTPGLFRLRAHLPAGVHRFEVAFLNDYFRLRDPPETRDRNLVVDWLTIEGPSNVAPAPSPTRDALVTCLPAPGEEEACARELLAQFGLRAWRRPLSEDELTRLLAFFALADSQGNTFEQGLRLALHAMLLSPHFLFRVELDPEPAGPDPHPLSAYELATRLSYFLWSSTPDDALLLAAQQGRLGEEASRRAEVARMLADPRAAALVENFGGQWLYTRALSVASPDPVQFPEWDEALVAAMSAETLAYFREFLSGAHDLRDLLVAPFTWLNDRLATHYGLPAPGSEELVRVELPEGVRGGLLAHGSLLTVTSHPDRTSPVLRGKWVLEQLLCMPPPPPPPGIPPIDESAEPGASTREQLEAHVSDPMCASCHDLMDPIGFGMDTYSAVGVWRTLDDTGHPIDATGELPGGRSFDGPFELAALLRDDTHLPGCFTEKLSLYALGRGLQPEDACALRALEEDLAQGEHRIPALIYALVESPTFHSRRPEGDAP